MSNLTGAIRQYRHNNSDDFVYAYDKEETEKVVRELNAQIEFKIKECMELAQVCNRWKQESLKKQPK